MSSFESTVSSTSDSGSSAGAGAGAGSGAGAGAGAAAAAAAAAARAETEAKAKQRSRRKVLKTRARQTPSELLRALLEDRELAELEQGASADAVEEVVSEALGDKYVKVVTGEVKPAAFVSFLCRCGAAAGAAARRHGISSSSSSSLSSSSSSSSSSSPLAHVASCCRRLAVSYLATALVEDIEQYEEERAEGNDEDIYGDGGR